MRGAAVVLVGAVVLRLVYGTGRLGYDAAWALEWGREAAHGQLPSYGAAGAPTPHPLPNLVSVMVAPFGDTAPALVLALSWLALAALGWVGFRLGRDRFGAPVGALFAALLLTRGLLVDETQQAVVDIPFLALTLAALAIELRRPRSSVMVPALLSAAGLLRPEGWLLVVAWLVYAAPGQPVGVLLRWGALAVSAPAIWVALDTLVTGDPFHSLHGTRELAETLDRPRGLGTAVSVAPRYLRSALGDPVALLGFVGIAAGLLWHYAPSLLPAGLTALGLAGFAILGAAGLPLLIRYLLLPAVLLALFAAVLMLGWLREPEGLAPVAAGVLALTTLAVFLPRQLHDVRVVHERAVRIAAVQRDLDDVLRRRAVRAAAGDCSVLVAPGARSVPVIAYALGRRPERIRVGKPAGGRALVIAYATARAADAFSFVGEIGSAGRAALPSGSPVIAHNASWIVASGC